MNGKFSKALVKFHKGEKGITGLETAIILIAFVTVAAVLAYSVLSAGVFSAEKGQEAVFSGLSEAQASMQILGNIYATGDGTNVSAIQFQLGTVLESETVDLDYVIVNYADDTTYAPNISVASLTGTLGPNEVADITINVSAYNLAAYDSFTIELIPQTGAALQFSKILPGEIEAVMNLN
jgi:flagellin FlaB